MGELADAITAEFQKKGLPIPKGVDTSSRPGRQIYGADANGVVKDGGGVRVSMFFMDEVPKDAELKDAARISIRDGHSLSDAQAIRDAAYSNYLASLRGNERRALSLPRYIDGYDVPKVLMAFADASGPGAPIRARAGIAQLLSVATTCRARAQAGQLSADEARNATAAADYIEGLAAAAELVLTGKVSKSADPVGAAI